MCFTAIGNCQLISQLYAYKGYRIGCTFKVLPTPLTVMGRETINDYNWMNPTRWRLIESALWGELGKVTRWEDAKKLRVKLVVHHVNVHARATETPHPSMQSLLTSLEVSADLFLSVKLDYITCVDATIVHQSVVKIEKSPLSPAWKALQPIVKVKRVDTSNFQDGGENNGGSSGQTNRPSRSRTRSVVKSRLPASRSRLAGSGLAATLSEFRELSNSKPIYVHDSDDTADSKDDDYDWLPSTSGSKLKAKRGRRSFVNDENFKSEAKGNSKSLSKTKSIRRFGQTSMENDENKPSTSSAANDQKEASLKPTPARGRKKPMPKSDKALKEKTPVPTPEPSPAKAPRGEQRDGAPSEAPPLGQILLLEYMCLRHAMASFKRYEINLDKLYNDRKHYNETLSYMGICHMDLMDILTADIRESMTKKLVQKYYVQPSHTSLILNGLMSLWIVMLFADTYNLCHDEAVRQIKYQKKWSGYFNTLDDDSLSFDPEDG